MSDGDGLWTDTWLARTAAERAVRVGTPQEGWQLFRGWWLAELRNGVPQWFQ
jgi:hypothetical protein